MREGTGTKGTEVNLETETGAWCESKVIRVRQARHGVLKETGHWLGERVVAR